MTGQTVRPRSGQLNLRRLSWLLLIAVASLAFWLAPVLYPLKIFAVFIHETGHALAAILTGGRVESMVVTPHESGYVRYVGGDPLLVASAGYVGSALFGGLMLLLAGRERWTTTIFGGLALLFGAMTVCFVRNAFGVGFGLTTAMVCGLLAWKPLPWARYVIDVLAVLSTLYAVYDLGDFLLVGATTDAVILARITGVPALLWAALWSVVSLFVVYAAGKRAVTRPSP